MLKTNNLEVSIDGKKILKGLNLNVNKGEVHAIMGPNGSGKSTLSMTIAGHSDYKVDNGEIFFEGQNILELEPFERAQLGIFLGFQYPVEIPGLNNNYFLQNALNAVRKSRGLDHVDAFDFKALVEDKLKIVGLSADFLSRGVNTGFSGGEKKKNEIFQLLVLDPKLAILDETDSGLDIDALKTVADGVNHFRNSENGVVLVTHYQRLLNYIQPDFVHILVDGKIVESGDFSLAQKIETEGYDWLRQKVENGGIYA